jgi:hypothetical protein
MDQGALASLAAIVGLLGRATWPLCSTRTGVLRIQLLIGVAFAAHYALINVATAAIVNALGSLQTATALLPLHARTMWYGGCGLIVAMAAASIASWAGPTSLLVTVGQAFIAIARMQRDVGVILALLLVGQLLWGVHDIVVGSPAAIAADAVGLLVGGWMLGRKCGLANRLSNSRPTGRSSGVALAIGSTHCGNAPSWRARHPCKMRRMACHTPSRAGRSPIGHRPRQPHPTSQEFPPPAPTGRPKPLPASPLSKINVRMRSSCRFAASRRYETVCLVVQGALQ